jgi:hypothetical protein
MIFANVIDKLGQSCETRHSIDFRILTKNNHDYSKSHFTA